MFVFSRKYADMPKHKVHPVSFKALDLGSSFVTRDRLADVIRKSASTIQPYEALSPNSIHENAQASDTSRHEGLVRSRDLRVDQFDSDAIFGGICSTFVFTSTGLLLTLSISYGRTKFILMDPVNLGVISELEVPKKKVPSLWRMLVPKYRDAAFRDVAGGAYFFLDGEDRAVLAAADGNLWVVSTKDETGKPRLALESKILLTVPEENYKLVSVSPQVSTSFNTPHEGYWVATANGSVGFIQTHASYNVPLETPLQVWTQVAEFGVCKGHATVSNGFAIDPQYGAFLVTCSRLYRFIAVKTADGTHIDVESYEYNDCRGQKILPGRYSVGSGTTPTLGEGFVTFGDGAQPMNVHVVNKKDFSIHGKKPVFSYFGACELSFIVVENSILAVNTYGYTNPLSWDGKKAPGTVKLTAMCAPSTSKHDIFYGGPAHYNITEDKTWSDNANFVDTGSSTPKLSADGIVYAYAPTYKDGFWEWHLFGLDFETGERIVDVLVFKDKKLRRKHDNGWGIVTVGPKHTLWLGMWTGFLRFVRQ